MVWQDVKRDTLTGWAAKKVIFTMVNVSKQVGQYKWVINQIYYSPFIRR